MRRNEGGRDLCGIRPLPLPRHRTWAKTSAATTNRSPSRRAAAGGRVRLRSREPMEDIIKAAVLGLVEGLTEYVPVSSTGHLLLMQHFFGFGDEDFGNTFAVLIQLGAILALLSIYFAKLWSIAIGMFSDPQARRF